MCKRLRVSSAIYVWEVMWLGFYFFFCFWVAFLFYTIAPKQLKRKIIFSYTCLQPNWSRNFLSFFALLVKLPGQTARSDPPFTFPHYQDPPILGDLHPIWIVDQDCWIRSWSHFLWLALPLRYTLIPPIGGSNPATAKLLDLGRGSLSLTRHFSQLPFGYFPAWLYMYHTPILPW